MGNIQSKNQDIHKEHTKRLDMLPSCVIEQCYLFEDILQNYLKDKNIYFLSNVGQEDRTYIYSKKIRVEYPTKENQELWKYIHIWIPTNKEGFHICICNWKNRNIHYLTTSCTTKYEFASILLKVIGAIEKQYVYNEPYTKIQIANVSITMSKL